MGLGRELEVADQLPGARRFAVLMRSNSSHAGDDRPEQPENVHDNRVLPFRTRLRRPPHSQSSAFAFNSRGIQRCEARRCHVSNHRRTI